MAAPRITGVSQTKENLLAIWAVPQQGMVQLFNEAGVAKDALWVGRNVHLFYGELRQRASWNGVKDATLALPIAALSANFFVENLTGIFTTRRANTRDRFLVAAGDCGVQLLEDLASALGGVGWVKVLWWQTDPNSNLNGVSSVSSPVPRVRTALPRFAEIAYGTPLQTFVVITNGVHT